MRERILRSMMGCLTLLCVAAADGPAPVNPEWQIRVDEILDGIGSEAALETFLGAAPIRCVPESDASLLCEWHLGSRNSGWKALADALRTRDKLVLVCKLTGDEPIGVGACAARPRRSNRSVTMLVPPPGRQLAYGERMARRERAQQVTRAWLDAAVTVADMSRLLGALPDQYGSDPRGGTARVYIWTLNRNHYGHGTVAASIGASYGDRVSWSCRFPADGSARTPGSCEGHPSE